MAMKLSSIVLPTLLVILLITFNVITLSAESPTKESMENEALLPAGGRFLASNKPRAVMTCDKYPRVCRGKGSGGPDCCYKQCVNVMSDELNCGKCGNKCKYWEICCQGKCVNPSLDEKHCGKCNNRCSDKGSSCVYGLCSYA
ncbi:hypothetical protein HS088_TW09G00189 [Tripterygium wilfordii]|uniref:Stigma-specific Stig1 family protein n=1 Tax=Tripterygium wilfordii TaxID=458696 RepID=A0A7J7D715_TRIWF|nr:stigma-specific STIG1-like protein 1 [Tripterygium wilfordii]KAF5742147.1 hypothetical protein HS088_TW09G00189 [Tripterygium wilfordii]